MPSFYGRLNSVIPLSLSIHILQETKNAILFRNGAVTYIITVKTEMRAQRIRVGPKSRESILIGDRKGTQRPQEDGQAKTEERLESCYYNPKKPG